MAFKVPPATGVVTSTTGTGAYALGAALTRHFTFAQAVTHDWLADGDTVPYCCKDAATPPNFEEGIGTFNAGPATLTRTTIARSSNGGAAVSWAAGSKDLWVGITSAHVVLLNAANKFTENLEVEKATPRLILDATGGTVPSVRWEAAGTLRVITYFEVGSGRAVFAYVHTDGTTEKAGLLLGDNVIKFRDSANGVTDIDHFAGGGGTGLWFKQSTAPSGWTKSTADNDAALRVVSGTPGASGGSRGLSAADTGGTALSEANLPPHTHPVGSGQDYPFIAPTGGTTPDLNTLTGGTRLWSVSSTTGSTGGGTNHTHPLALKYVDGMIATKN